MKTIKKGDIVRYERGYYKITAIRGNKANLGSIFGKGIYYKGIAVDELVEAHDEWYKKWQQSDAYNCM